MTIKHFIKLTFTEKRVKKKKYIFKLLKTIFNSLSMNENFRKQSVMFIK